MPVVIFFACLDLEEKSSFLDGHKLINPEQLYWIALDNLFQCYIYLTYLNQHNQKKFCIALSDK
jgi:hypothetical protein